MKKLFAAILVLGLAGGLAQPMRADDAADAKVIIDKAIKALGGEEALGKVKAASWKAKTTLTFNNTDNSGTSEVTMQGVDHYRQEFNGEFNGMKFKGVFLLAGDKGVRSFGGQTTPLEKDALAAQKRMAYLAIIPVTLLALKEKEFKSEPIAEEKIDDKPAVGLKVTAPDMKDFKLYFNKDSGLPVRLVAKVTGFQPGMEFTQETNFSDYKDAAGIKKAMKIVSKRDGEKFQTMDITEFKAMEKVDPKVFTEVE